MFGKKKCQRCNNKLSKDFEYCPYCALPLTKKANEEDFGMFGKNDLEEEMVSNSFFGGLTDKVIEKMISSTFRMLEKEMSKQIKNQENLSVKNQPNIKKNFQFFINGKRVNLDNASPLVMVEKKREKIKLPNTSEEKIKKYKSLPKEEPKTSVRRLSNRLIYEIELPGVKSEEDISIIPLENSIEIKATGKDKAYSKIIPLNFPVINYKISEEKLFLELEAK